MKSNKFEIYNSMVFEFLMSLMRLENNKFLSSLSKTSNSDTKESAKIETWVSSTLADMPDEKRKILSTFFNQNFAPGSSMTIISSKYKIKDIKSFIKKIDEISCEEFISIIIDSKDFYEIEDKNAFISEALNNQNYAFKFIDEKCDLEPNLKWIFLQFFTEPLKLKNSLSQFFKWYYENIFSHQEKYISSFLKSYQEKLYNELELSGESFLNSFIKNQPYDKLKLDKVILSVSYYLERGIFQQIFNEDTTEVFIAGFEYTQNAISNLSPITESYRVFKALSDETRLNIIRLLTERPWYGTELAEELNLSNSTVSHHLSILVFSEIITVERVNKRFYFSLNKENFLKLLNESANKILK